MDSLRILLVEDEPDLRSLVCQALEVLGHRVTVAVDGRHALEVLEEAEFDVICSDVAMPNGISGIELAERARIRHPQARILLTSGFPRSELGALPEGAVFLPKPYRILQLLKAIAGSRSRVTQHGLG